MFYAYLRKRICHIELNGFHTGDRIDAPSPPPRHFRSGDCTRREPDYLVDHRVGTSHVIRPFIHAGPATSPDAPAIHTRFNGHLISSSPFRELPMALRSRLAHGLPDCQEIWSRDRKSTR